ncbi:nocturnin-like [Ruditapes philippinarum]|uniref:nocturnin-like n=1 Tax=Ruditapes philippinarum TaxID=129788 RepID=UPI00295BB121|nr:nocturnin-like [Ruditapes philippinarum]
MASSEHSHVPAEVKAEISKLELPPLIHRDFVEISSDTGDIVRVMQWNILAQGLCGGADNFMKCPKEALEFESRKLRVLEEITRYCPTVICLEEVDFYPYLFECLSKLGYAGVYSEKPDSPCLYQTNNIGPDGTAILYDTSKLVLSQSDSKILKENGEQSNHVTVIAQFQTKTKDPKIFYVGATHLKAKRGYEEKRKLQGQYISNYLQENCNDAPVIYCGDFNAEATEPVYSVMKSCSIGLNSAYTLLSKNNEEPKYTTWKIRPKGEECHTIDYIWYSNKGLKVKSVLNIAVEEEIGKNRLPSLKYPSDHFVTSV